MEAILARADGVPMYAVETVRALVADCRLERSEGSYRPVGDLSELRVPETLQSLIGSRLDALDPVDRGLLQDGAVLGQTFSAASLAAVAGLTEAELEPRLRGLVRRELVQVDVDPRSPERGQHGFVQSLVREVAYSTLARRDRRARHLAVARYFESLDDPEVAGALASHYLAAQQASAEGPEADALAIQARRALRAAAERAIDLGADDQSVTYVEQALSITTSEHERAELQELAATAGSHAAHYETAIASATAAIAAYRSDGDVDGVARASDLLGTVQIDASLLTEARETLVTALGEVAARPEQRDGALRAVLEARLSRVLMRVSEYPAAIEAADRALAIAERDRLEAIVAEALINKGSTLGGLGRWREGSALLETRCGSRSGSATSTASCAGGTTWPRRSGSRNRSARSRWSTRRSMSADGSADARTTSGWPRWSGSASTPRPGTGIERSGSSRSSSTTAWPTSIGRDSSASGSR
jgi:tetratricopeptide (TPR) repeat protein